MAQANAAEEAAAYARVNHALGVGLHLDLAQWTYTSGTWVADYEVVPVDDAQAVTREIERQLDLFEVLVGRPPTHLDSHQHVHRSEPVRSALRAAGRRLGVPVRHLTPRIAYRGDFYGRTKFGEPLPEAVTADALIGILTDLPEGVSELCCHPATRGDVDPAYGSERVFELAALCDPRVLSTIAAAGIRTRSFVDAGALLRCGNDAPAAQHTGGAAPPGPPRLWAELRSAQRAGRA
ncbi:MAG: ChbG/HpnK family deacetylase [Chloroflexi bacterium]|nr:ChbG/HpnK family deacetylase [Chloroflexota bacterium]